MSLGKRKHNQRPGSQKGNPVKKQQPINVPQVMTNDDIAALALQGWYYDRHGHFVPPATPQPEIRRVWSIYPWKRG